MTPKNEGSWHGAGALPRRKFDLRATLEREAGRPIEVDPDEIMSMVLGRLRPDRRRRVPGGQCWRSPIRL